MKSKMASRKAHVCQKCYILATINDKNTNKVSKYLFLSQEN